MIEVKSSAQTATTNLRVIPQTQVLNSGEPSRRSRHAAITRDLYTYQGYKTWMHNLRHTQEKK
jgi:hypothetical protein